MKLFVLLLALINTPAYSANFIALENHAGATIMAQPILLKDDMLTIKRNDDTTFTISLNSLTDTSISQIDAYFNKIIDRNSIKKLETAAPVFEYDRSGEFITLATFYDKKDDQYKTHNSPEFDLWSVTLEKKQGNKLAITLLFTDAFPELPINEGQYRIWLKLDLDNNPNTGAVAKGGMGEDLSVAITLNGKGKKPSSYTVPKSELGRDTKLKVTNIKATSHSISAVLDSNALRRSKTIGIYIAACAGLGKGVDNYPDYKPFRFSFNKSKYLAAQSEH